MHVPLAAYVTDPPAPNPTPLTDYSVNGIDFPSAGVTSLSPSYVGTVDPARTTSDFPDKALYVARVWELLPADVAPAPTPFS